MSFSNLLFFEMSIDGLTNKKRYKLIPRHLLNERIIVLPQLKSKLRGNFRFSDSFNGCIGLSLGEGNTPSILTE